MALVGLVEQDAAKRIHAMLDLAEAAQALDFEPVERQIGRIRSAAGPVAAIVVPGPHVRTCADMLYRTRTLVATRLALADPDAIARSVSDGAGEIELPAPGDCDLVALTAAALRRCVKVPCRATGDSGEDLRRFDAAGIRFAIMPDALGRLREAARSIATDNLRIGLKVTGCNSFAACQAVYDTIADTVGEAWIWPGTLRFEATEALHDDVVSRLRDGTLSRPVGCGIRLGTMPR